MAKLEYASSFRDLIVYRKARELSLSIFKITKRFPKEEDYSLTDQIRRSSRSLGAQISKAEQFCNPSRYQIREEQANYFVNSSAQARREN